VFLLSLAIVDDIGAILVIALFYSGGIQAQWLVVAGLLLALIVVLRRVKVLWVPVYVVIGTVVWLAIFESGVHATIAGVALGLLTPARPTDPGGFPDVLEHAANLSSEPDAQSLRAVAFQAAEVVSVAERLEHLLHPWTSYLIIPLFALANAGVAVSGETLGNAIASPVALGIILGLVVGKVIGISAFSWLAIKLRLGEAPPGVRPSQLVGTAAVAGIGFTVSLFITALAFEEQELVDAAKMGVLIGSSLAGLLGATILLLGPRSEDPVEE
jgi:NhaA family Na+:H+ antiporter